MLRLHGHSFYFLRQILLLYEHGLPVTVTFACVSLAAGGIITSGGRGGVSPILLQVPRVRSELRLPGECAFEQGGPWAKGLSGLPLISKDGRVIPSQIWDGGCSEAGK